MTTHQALYLMVGEVKGELHYLKNVIFFAYIFISNKHSLQMSNATVNWGDQDGNNKRAWR